LQEEDRVRSQRLTGIVLATAVSCLGAATDQPRDETPAAEELAALILKRADEVRFPKTSFEVSVVIQTSTGGQHAESRQYKVLSQGNENTLVMTTEPASERGQILLMKGRDLWLFVPNVSQPVRLSLAQRLTGQVANGDIARANFAGDYLPRLVGTEMIGQEALHVLELKAVDRAVTYQRVRYWVRQKNAWPYKAEFYSLSNRLLKTCVYEDYRQLGDRVRPTRLVMTDALRSAEVSVMEYGDLRTRDLPDKVFTKEYLKKLQ
jgi:outer membrane lipoprotein-sorting protein